MRHIFQSDVLSWRLAGALVWQALYSITFLIVSGCFKDPRILVSPTRLVLKCFSLSPWIDLGSMLIIFSPAAALHAAMLTTKEPAVKFHSALHYLPSPVAIIIRKVSSRTGTLAGSATLVAYFVGHALSASLFALLIIKINSRYATAYQVIWLSLGLSATYLCHVLYYSRYVLQFPTIQRHRYFRIKQLALQARVVVHVVAVAATGCIAGTTASILAGHYMPSAIGIALFFVAGCFCVFMWLLGSIILEVVFTERLQAHDYGTRDPLAGMTDCLDGKQGVIMCDLALNDLAVLSEEPQKAAWRRTDVFRDESGDRWSPLGQHCVASLAQLSTAMAEALPRKSSRSDAGNTSSSIMDAPRPSRMKWNAVPSALMTRTPVAQRQNIDAIEAVRCSYQTGKYAARALTGFAVASLKEDRFGVLQLADPSLGDVLVAMMSALLAAKRLARQVVGVSAAAALGPWKGTGDVLFGSEEPDAAIYALQDELKTDLYRIVDAFGPALADALTKSRAVPTYGEREEVAEALRKFMQGQWQ